MIRKELESYRHEDPPEPKNPEQWYKLYRKLHRAEQKEIQKQEELLVGQLQGLKDSAAERTSKVVDPRSLPRLKRALGGRVGKRPSSTATKNPSPSQLRFTSGSRTKAVSGQDVLNKAKREAREMSYFSMRGTSGLAKPSHQGPTRANAPSMAPKSLVSDHQRPKGYKDGQIPAGSISVPRRSSAAERKESVTSPPMPSKKVQPTSRQERAEGSTSSKHLQPPSSEDTASPSERERKMTKVPRVASRSPVGHDRAQVPKQGSPPRPKPEVDIFMPVKRRRKI